MNRESLLKLYDRLTGLVEKLPGGLQKPILRELVPIRQLFLEQRPARILLLGNPEPGADLFLQSLRQTPPPLPPSESAESPRVTATSSPPPLETGELDNGWRHFVSAPGAEVLALDARPSDFSEELFAQAMQRFLPDAIVVFYDPDAPEEEFRRAMQQANSIPREEKAASPRLLLGLAKGQSEKAVDRLRSLLLGGGVPKDCQLRVLPATDYHQAGEAICAFLPNQAKLEFANFAELRAARAEIAKSLLKSFTAVCAVIGMQPIPLADLPVLTTLQSLMVGLIAYTGGRRLGARTATEFFGAVGVSVGVGMAFREGARALIKVVPGFGNAISGLVAGAGTYAIGRSAIAYFIEEVPVEEARKIFRSLRPKRKTFLKETTASLPEGFGKKGGK